MVFDDGTNKLQLNVEDLYLQLSSTTVSAGLQIGPQNITASGASLTSGSLYLGNTLFVNSSAIWVGPTTNLIGFQGATGAQGPQGNSGTLGPQGAQGAVGPQGAQGA